MQVHRVEEVGRIDQCHLQLDRVVGRIAAAEQPRHQRVEPFQIIGDALKFRLAALAGDDDMRGFGAAPVAWGIHHRLDDDVRAGLGRWGRLLRGSRRRKAKAHGRYTQIPADAHDKTLSTSAARTICVPFG